MLQAHRSQHVANGINPKNWILNTFIDISTGPLSRTPPPGLQCPFFCFLLFCQNQTLEQKSPISSSSVKCSPFSPGLCCPFYLWFLFFWGFFCLFSDGSSPVACCAILVMILVMSVAHYWFTELIPSQCQLLTHCSLLSNSCHVVSSPIPSVLDYIGKEIYAATPNLMISSSSELSTSSTTPSTSSSKPSKSMSKYSSGARAMSSSSSSPSRSESSISCG